MKYITKALALPLVLTGAFQGSFLFAQDQIEKLPEQSDLKVDYIFRQPYTPIALSSNNTVTYAMSPNSVCATRGDVLLKTKHDIKDFDLNPTGVSFIAIQKDKKGRTSASTYDIFETDSELIRFDAKKYGMPTAAAYAADATKLYVATDKGLYIFEPRKMTLLDQMEIPFVPTSIAISENSYYMAFCEGQRVAIYNLEQKKLRRDWNYGVDVNDMTFNSNSTEFAVVTNDGFLTVYDTRTFNIKTDFENLGEGLACAFNFDNKYIAVATSPTTVELINMVRPEDRNTIPVESGGVKDLSFIKDTYGNSILVYTMNKALGAKRLMNLEPHYVQLVSDKVDKLMDEWLKMMPNESMEEYKLRVNDDTRAKQRRFFEDEISTSMAGDLISGQTMSLGNYDRTNQLLELDFSSMPTIYLPVPENDVTSFHDAGDLLLSDVQYGVLPDDTFEIIYAKVFNKADGKTYEYNNKDRVAMRFMDNDAQVVSLEILQQQQMEEIKLQELREKVVEEARHNDVISNHTNISVDSKVVPDYDADGNKILNYQVNFTYEVDPEFSVFEDFPSGKYHIDESGAASSMLKIVKEAFDGDFAQHLKPGKKVKVIITGTADATPIIRTIPYDGIYGDFVNEPIYENGDITAITVTKSKGIEENRQLAFLRAQGVKKFLEDNISKLKDTKTDYSFHVNVSEGKGSEFRRITTNFIIYDVFD